MTPTVEATKWEIERAQVQRFVSRFEESYRELLYLAALPLVLTPELVNYLRNEFLRHVPWVVEVDLLLSDLCSQVGYELYAMDTQVRAYLLEEVREKPDWQQRLQEAARVLISYVNYLSRVNPQQRQHELQAQRWAAMVYLDDESCREAAREIAEQLQRGSDLAAVGGTSEQGIRAEMARLARIAQELELQLRKHPSLIEYAELVQRILKEPETVSPTELQRSFEVEGVELKPTKEWLPAELAEALDAPISLPGFPPFKVLNFEVATLVPKDSPAAFPALKSFEFDYATIALVPAGLPADINLVEFSFEVVTLPSGPISTEMVHKAALNLLDEAVSDHRGQHLERVEKAILQGALNNDTYDEIAEAEDQPVTQLKNIGRQLWKMLVEVLGEKVTKTNFRPVLKQWFIPRSFPRSQQQAQQFVEDLGNDVTLDMVLIPKGEFLMGSPKEEEGYEDIDGPQHQVTVPLFFMGKYPITQAQWQAVAALPQVNRKLESDPSRFKASDRPVETVSWYDAVEFCKRLSAHTGREYRLPTEAEWEYACRAGTITPFHFGETITTDLANYDGDFTYGVGFKGEFREETTPVDHFGFANAFGLYDMHGNVWEWCQDHWHESYTEKPKELSQAGDRPWLSEDEDSQRICRGGSWDDVPQNCRSAYRFRVSPGNDYYNLGFRVVCVAPRTS